MPSTDITLGWVIVYVDDPARSIAFYEKTFGLTKDFVSPGNEYGQFDTGATKLAFASYGLGEKNFPGGVRRGDDRQPANVEITLVSEDVDAVYENALAAGCESLAEPQDKPHGQRVAFVRDPDGTLVELGTPM
jgi:predicted enzyme related to lactoylglutathione lyase